MNNYLTNGIVECLLYFKSEGDMIAAHSPISFASADKHYSIAPLIMPKCKTIAEGLALVFQGIERLKTTFPHRRFTVDGRLVGDVGEIIAELEYDVILHKVSQPDHDGNTTDGRNVQVKATFKDSLTFKTTPDYYLGFKLYPDGRYEEIFNGPGRLIQEQFAHRSGIGTTCLSFPISALRELSKQVAPHERIPKRES